MAWWNYASINYDWTHISGQSIGLINSKTIGSQTKGTQYDFGRLLGRLDPFIFFFLFSLIILCVNVYTSLIE